MIQLRTNWVIFFSLLIIGGGLYSAVQSKVQLMPNVQHPKISFRVNWPNASENFLLTQVVRPYEQALLNKVDNLQDINVEIADERATFELVFAFGTQLQQAEQNIRTLLSQTRPLPINVPPLYFFHGGNNVSNRVVASYFVVSDTGEFSDNQKQILKQLVDSQIKNIKGVESVNLIPLLDRELVFELDPVKLAHFKLPYWKVHQSIREMFSDTSGTISDDQTILKMRYDTPLTIEEFKQSPIDYIDGVLIKFADVGRVEVRRVKSEGAARYNGQNAIVLRILRFDQDDLTKLQTAVVDVLEKNQALLKAAGLTFNLSFDTAQMINNAIFGVISSIFAGFVLSLLVSFVFLRRVSPTILGGFVTLLSVSVSLIVMYNLNVSVNVITLAGITFSVGMFVDGALIVAEHLNRHNSKTVADARPLIKQLTPALVASMLTSVVVFSPIIFNNEPEGKLFSGLAIVIVTGLAAALFFTLTLAPFFARFFVQSNNSKEVPQSSVLQKISTLTDKAGLRVMVISVILVGSVSIVVLMLPSLSYLPTVKRDAIDIIMPLAGDQEIDFIGKQYVEPILNAIEQDHSLPEISTKMVVYLPRVVSVGIKLKDNQQLPEAVVKLRKLLSEKIPEKRLIVMQGNLFDGLEDSNNVELNLFVPDQLWLSEKQKAIQTLIIEHVDGVSVRFEPNLHQPQKTLMFTPKRENLRFFDAHEGQVKSVIRALTDADYVGSWSYQGESLNANFKIHRQLDINSYGDITVVLDSQKQTYLRELVLIDKVDTVRSLNRKDGVSVMTIKIGLTDKNKTVSQVLTQLENDVLPQLDLLLGDKGSYEINGSAASLNKAKQFIVLMFVAIFLAFFIIVSVVYRSTTLGLYVLATLPFAIAGGVLGFVALHWFVELHFTVLTVIGFTIMLGVVANNSILLVDGISRNFYQTGDLSTAVSLGMQQRFRPVLMSTATTIAGMLPLLFFPTEANYLYRDIAAVLVGGIVANLMSVFCVTAAIVKQFGLPKLQQKQPQALEKLEIMT